MAYGFFVCVSSCRRCFSVYPSLFFEKCMGSGLDNSVFVEFRCCGADGRKLHTRRFGNIRNYIGISAGLLHCRRLFCGLGTDKILFRQEITGRKRFGAEGLLSGSLCCASSLCYNMLLIFCWWITRNMTR